MSTKSDVVPEPSRTRSKGGKGFIKRNPWILLVGVFAVMIVIGIVAS